MLLKACALHGNQECVSKYRQSRGCARLQDMCTRYVVGDWRGGTYVLVAEADLNLVAKAADLVKDQTVCAHVPMALHSRLSQHPSLPHLPGLCMGARCNRAHMARKQTVHMRCSMTAQSTPTACVPGPLARASQGCLLHPCTHFAYRLSCPIVNRQFVTYSTTGPDLTRTRLPGPNGA